MNIWRPTTLRSRIIVLFVVFGATILIAFIGVLAWSPDPPIAATSVVLTLLFLALGGASSMAASLARDAEVQMAECRQNVEESSYTLRNFMYHIAHTLRTPLNAIRWTVETLKNEETGNITEEQRELLDKLEYSSVSLLRMADELQDALIVLRGEPLHMRMTTCTVVPIIDTVAGAWAVSARRKKISLVWKRPAKALPSVWGDEARIRQVLDAIVDNAVHYTKTAGKVMITVDVIGEKPTPAQMRQLRLPSGIYQSMIISVRDQGIGIPPSDQDHIFQAFYRASNAKDSWVDGKGLGLTLARAITRQLGGSIWLTSAKGKGTTVSFSLPIVF